MNLDQHTTALMNSAVSAHSGGDNQAFFYIDGIPTKGEWFDLDMVTGWHDIEGKLADAFSCEVDEVLCADVEGLAKHFYTSSCDSFNLTEWLEFKESRHLVGLSDEVVDAYLSNCGIPCDLSDISEAYYGEFSSDEDFAYDLLESCGDLDSNSMLANYFDYEKYARDLMMGDFFEVNGHYFRNI